MGNARNAILVNRQMVDDICGSVPYHMGTRMNGESGDEAGVEYSFHAANATSQDQRRASAALGGWHLIEPLKIASSLTCLREYQQKWLTQQLICIGKIYPVDLLSKPKPSHKCAGSEQARSPGARSRASLCV